MTTNICRWMSTVLNPVVKFYDLTQLIFSNCISCCSFSHTLQCGQIEKLMPQLSLAHAASFYLKSSSFGKKIFEICPSFLFWCKCYFFHEAILSISLFSPLPSLPIIRNNLLFLWTPKALAVFWHSLLLTFISFIHLCEAPSPTNSILQWSVFSCLRHLCA